MDKNPVVATKLLRQPRDLLRFDLLASRARGSGLGFFLCFANAFFERAHGEVRLFFVDEQWWRQPNGVLARSEDAKSLVESEIDNDIAEIRGFFLRTLIADDFNADHQAAPANVADDLELFRPVGQTAEKVFAHAAGILEILAFDQI